ncbi:MAG: hypothetical protein PHW53_04515 [Patescibacteria group bacterium]|nr:hypothetical protein [Patescibacteria group bacterium]
MWTEEVGFAGFNVRRRPMGRLMKAEMAAKVSPQFVIPEIGKELPYLIHPFLLEILATVYHYGFI